MAFRKAQPGLRRQVRGVAVQSELLGQATSFVTRVHDHVTKLKTGPSFSITQI